MYLLSRRLFLASQSPRRRELLKRFGIPYNEIAQNSHEPDTHFSDPCKAAKNSAKLKAQNAAVDIDNGIILGFDTIVYYNNKILEKPRDKDEAYSMLTSLSGSPHVVYTGMAAVLKPENSLGLFCEASSVIFRKLEEKEIISNLV